MKVPSYISILSLDSMTHHQIEMVENMKSVASSDQELSVEERNLLSVAYKNVIGARRASWRIVSSIEQKEESKGNEAQVTLIKEYRRKIEQELAKICDDILSVLDNSLIPAAGSGESKVFYYKMYAPPSIASFIDVHLSMSRIMLIWNRKGDYHRYLAEFALGETRKNSADKSLEAYKAASDVAVTELPPTHPVSPLHSRANNSSPRVLNFTHISRSVSVLPLTFPYSTTKS